MSYRAITLLALLSWPVAAGGGMLAQEPVNYDIIQRIKDEAFNRSRIAELVSTIADVYGPRFSNSPCLQRSYRSGLARQAPKEFGVDARAIEAYGNAGVGWQNEYTSMHMLEPQYHDD